MDVVRDRTAMLAGLAPWLDPESYVFCSTDDPGHAGRAAPLALASFREAEGVSLVLAIATARRLGFDVTLPMRRIVLGVPSALDGVGLTAAVSGALAAAGIACNVVAAHHHDHLFIPAGKAAEALAILEALQREARGAAPG